MVVELGSCCPGQLRLVPAPAAEPLLFSSVGALRFSNRPFATNHRFSASPQPQPPPCLDGATGGFAGRRGRVFFLDVNPLCYEGARPSLRSFAHWISLFFSQVSLRDPVVAVFDGDDGNEFRRRLLPSYKAHRRRKFSRGDVGGSVTHSEALVTHVLQKCNVPVVKVNGYEADDTIATLAGQVLERGQKVVIGSPDKDFKQLVSENVQIVMPMPEFGRWSFYTLKHYLGQYGCDPSLDLSLRCILGDDVDGVPGIQHVAPGFGRKTALKLLKKYGSLHNLLDAAVTRTVAKKYAQDALVMHADYLRRNYEILSLRRDADIYMEEDWLLTRDCGNDSEVLLHLAEILETPHIRREKIEAFLGCVSSILCPACKDPWRVAWRP